MADFSLRPTIAHMEKQNIQVIKRLTRSNGSALADAELWEKTLWEEEHGWLRFGGLPSRIQEGRAAGPIANYSTLLSTALSVLWT